MRKIIILLILIFNTTLVFSQNICQDDILNDEEIIEKDITSNFIIYDFSNIWLATENRNIFGIIGNDYQRIKIKFLTVARNENNPNEYLVYGKSNVKNQICDFAGKITIKKIQEIKREHFGVDDEFKNSGIKAQGLLTAKYEFYENKNQTHSGIFSGELKSKWILDKGNLIKYDDINSVADGYFNNSFVGVWKMYDSNNEKKCNWADFRVPNIECDFDIGAGEFSPCEKYQKNGWKNYQKAWINNDAKAKEIELSEWWK